MAPAEGRVQLVASEVRLLTGSARCSRSASGCSAAAPATSNVYQPGRTADGSGGVNGRGPSGAMLALGTVAVGALLVMAFCLHRQMDLAGRARC